MKVVDRLFKHLSWESVNKYMTLKPEWPEPVLAIVNKQNRPDFAFKVVSDASWGGRSTAHCHYGALPCGGTGIIFEGNLSLDRRTGHVKDAKDNSKPFGFAALTIERADGGTIDCSDYEFISMDAITDGRIYTLSLRGASWVARDVTYQAYFAGPQSSTYSNYELPFDQLIATRGGKLTDAEQRLSSDSIILEKFSITINDDKPGPFRFVIDNIRCTNFDVSDPRCIRTHQPKDAPSSRIY